MAADRFVGVDSADPRLPESVVTATTFSPTEGGTVPPAGTDPAAVLHANGTWGVSVGVNEVHVGPSTTRTDPTTELWWDTEIEQLMVNVNGVFQPAADIPPNEVFVGTTEPTPDVELWVDTNTDPAILKGKVNGAWVPVGGGGGGGGVPPGGAGGTALTKASATDGDTRWGGDLNTGSIFPASGEVIQFPNTADVAKINTYDKTFGVGIESGTQTYFASSRHRFRAGTPTDAAKGGMTSPVVAEFEAGRLGPASNINVSWQNGFTGSAQFRVNPAMVTLSLWHFVNGVELLSYAQVKMFDYPAGVPAPWMNVSGAVAPQWMGSTYGYIPLRIDCMTDGVWCYPNSYIDVGDLWECVCTVTWAR